MRGRDDRAASNQRADDALYRARLRAVSECQARITPETPGRDSVLAAAESLALAAAWDRLNVEYLRAEWPPSMLN
jgi:hypothetical protein